METLKHHWSPTQTKILLALKDELKRCPVQCIETSLLCDAMFFYYDLYCKKGDKKAFFEVWHESCQMLPLNKDHYYHRQPETSLLLPIHLVCQTAAGIFLTVIFSIRGTAEIWQNCVTAEMYFLFIRFSAEKSHTFQCLICPRDFRTRVCLRPLKAMIQPG